MKKKFIFDKNKQYRKTICDIKRVLKPSFFIFAVSIKAT